MRLPKSDLQKCSSFKPQLFISVVNFSTMKSPVLLLCLGCAAARDLDGDGLEDAAAEGECCIGGYGNTFTNEYNCGTTIAEVQAGGCCAASFLLRYSLQPCGEDTNRWDCVSFVDKAGCTAKGSPYQWSADVGAQCPHTAAAIATPPAHHCDSALASGPFLATALLAAVGTAL